MFFFGQVFSLNAFRWDVLRESVCLNDKTMFSFLINLYLDDCNNNSSKFKESKGGCHFQYNDIILKTNMEVACIWLIWEMGIQGYSF